MPKEMPGLAILLGKMKEKPHESDSEAVPGDGESKSIGEEHDEDRMGEHQEEDSAVSAMITAVKDEDVEGFKEALQAFLEICYPQLESEEKGDGGY